MIGLLLTGSIALHLDQTRDVSTATESAVLGAIEDAILRRTGQAPILDASVWAEGCAPNLECISVTLVGGVTKLRILAARVSAGGVLGEAKCDLPRDSATWPAILDGLIADLGLARGFVETTPPPATVATSPKWWPWIFVGAGLAAVAAGIAFGVSSRDASNAVDDGPRRGDAYLSLLDRSRDHAVAANILYATGAVSFAGGWVLVLVFE
jgi:hypothetical protein